MSSYYFYSFVFIVATDFTNDTFDENNDSININETLNNSDVIENSVIESTLESINDTANASSNRSHSIHSDSDDSAETDDDDNKTDGDLSHSLVISEVNVSADESDPDKPSTSTEAHDDSIKSETDISADESDENKIKPVLSSKVLNISDSEDDVQLVKGKKLSRMYIIDSSDDNSTNEMAGPSTQIKKELKMENGIKSESDVKIESRAELKAKPTVKFETGLKFESDSESQPKASKLDPLKLVDDVKPIFTGKSFT